MKNAELISSIINDWWYYSVELAPGIITKGMDTPQTPMLPRMMVRNCNLENMDCLDIGSMEGLIPIAMKRKGAKNVVATDAIPHCEKKMNALKEIYGVNFDFHTIGLLYDITAKLKPIYKGFDFINLSGVLYHVFSPMHVLAGIRPLLKKNGLMVISTNVINRNDHTLEFNKSGYLQRETNTFWYHSIPMLEELMRFFKLVPIDFLYFPHSPVNPYSYVQGLDSGYISVVCRAVEGADVENRDLWASTARRSSWEYLALCDNAHLDSQDFSLIQYAGNEYMKKDDGNGLSMIDEIKNQNRIISVVSDSKNSQTLRLNDMS